MAKKIGYWTSLRGLAMIAMRHHMIDDPILGGTLKAQPAGQV